MGIFRALDEQATRRKALEDAMQRQQADQQLADARYNALSQIAPIIPQNEAELRNLTEIQGYIPSPDVEGGYILPRRQFMQDERAYQDQQAQNRFNEYQNQISNPLFNIGDTLMDVANNTIGLPLKLLGGGQDPFGNPSQKAKASYEQDLEDIAALQAYNAQTYENERNKRATAFAQAFNKQPSNQAFENATKLRGEFATQSKDFVKQNAAMGRIAASVQNPSPAGDLALIFNYMKLLDPGSTVREGEFATAQNAAGIPQRIIAQYNSIVNGEKLGEEQRNDFFDRSNRLYQEAVKQHEVMRTNYLDLSNRFGVNPDDVLLDFRTYRGVDEGGLNNSQDNSQDNRQNPPPPPPGFQLMQDANGNQAYVNPNTGEVREIK